MAAISDAAAASVSKRARVETTPALLEPVKQTVIVSNLSEPSSDASGVKIGTHDGKFHCDEALACAMLKLLPRWRDAVLVRTRDTDMLAQCDIVVDVGATYDPATLRFDHHQKTFDGTLNELGFATKLSSAGLVYKHFGRDVIAEVTGGQLPAEVVEIMYHKVYKGFIEHIDAIDNGIEVSDGPLKYDVSSDLSSRVGRLYPSWNEDSSPAIVNEQFRAAVLLTGTELLESILYLQNSWWPARSFVEQAIVGAPEVDPCGQILVLDNHCPWTAHLFALEEEKSVGPFNFMLYTDNRNMWRVHAVPVSEGSFQSRTPLLEAWRGLRDDALVEACGIQGATFVHASGFIGGNATREGAIAMAKATLKALGTIP